MTAKLYFQYMAQATGETLLMVFLSTLFSALVGIPLGVLAAYTDKNGVRPTDSCTRCASAWWDSAEVFLS